MRLHKVTIMILTLAGFALRLHYLITTHPFFDEFTTILAARQILQHGWPILPSGLFYEHGLLATYVIAPFAALFINTPWSQWQPAHWGLMLARWPSVLLGTVTIPLIYALGRHGLKSKASASNLRSSISLLAAGLFALSPEGMVWGGRARMYALATLLVLLTVYWAYRGAHYPAPVKYRWWGLAALLATLLTQFGAMMLVPALGVGMAIIGWRSWRNEVAALKLGVDKDKALRSRLAAPPWFLRPAILIEGFALAAVVVLAIWVKRLGRPLGAVDLGSVAGGNLGSELLNTVTYQTAFRFTWSDTIHFLARQFGVPHHFWLTILALSGAILGLIFGSVFAKRLTADRRPRTALNPQPTPPLPPQARRRGHASERHTTRSVFDGPSYSTFNLFLWLVFGLIILEMVILLDPFRRNPRYLVMYLPLFYLIAANAIFNILLLTQLVSRNIHHVSRLTSHVSRLAVSPFTVLTLLIFFTILGFNDLKIALLTPEPAYEEAFAWIQANRGPDDAILTMNTPAAGLYLGYADGFTVQEAADQFLLNADTKPVDRWLGARWLGSAAAFNAALNASDQSWFVIDTIRQPVYFRGDWLAVVNSQMEQVWAKDNALVYRTRPGRLPMPTQPDILLNAVLGDNIHLIGYTLQSSSQPANQPTNLSSNLHLTLFWQPHTSLPTDYTTFLHLRNENRETVAQHDGQPLAGAYPTSQWLPGETVIDPITLQLPKDLPAGQYRLLTGLYRLDTLERLRVVNDTSGENAILLGEISLP